MNPLMANMGPMSGITNMMQTVSNIKQMLSGQNPDAVMQMMAKNNPQFAQFVQENKNKSPEQIAKDYGLDWNSIQNLLK